MVRRMRFIDFFPVESTTCGANDSGCSGTPIVTGAASGAASISGSDAGSGSGSTTFARGGVVIGREGPSLFAGAAVFVLRPLAGLRPGTGIDWSMGITAATVRGVMSFRASVGALISCRGVRTRAAIVDDRTDAPERTRWAHASSTAPTRATRRVRCGFRRRRALLVGCTDASGSGSRGGAGILAGTGTLGGTAACRGSPSRRSSAMGRACIVRGCATTRGSGAGVPNLIGSCGGGLALRCAGGRDCGAGAELGFGSGHAARAACVALSRFDGAGGVICA